MLISIRSAFSLSRQDALAGGRIATIALLPLIFGSLTGRAELGLMGYLGGLYACMADVGGAYQTRALSMGYAAVFTALAAFLSTLAGSVVWLAVPLMFFGAFLGSMVSIYFRMSRSSGPGMMRIINALPHERVLLLQSGKEDQGQAGPAVQNRCVRRQRPR